MSAARALRVKQWRIEFGIKCRPLDATFAFNERPITGDVGK